MKSRPPGTLRTLAMSDNTYQHRSFHRSYRRVASIMGIVILTATMGVISTVRADDDPSKKSESLRIICFGAHPDDAEYKSGGTAALWAQQGHQVKLVSVTNGDIGHWAMAGGPLAVRRAAESAEVARRLGVESEVLDIHDGELMPTLDPTVRPTVGRCRRARPTRPAGQTRPLVWVGRRGQG